MFALSNAALRIVIRWYHANWLLHTKNNYSVAYYSKILHHVPPRDYDQDYNIKIIVPRSSITVLTKTNRKKDTHVAVDKLQFKKNI